MLNIIQNISVFVSLCCCNSNYNKKKLSALKPQHFFHSHLWRPEAQNSDVDSWFLLSILRQNLFPAILIASELPENLYFHSQYHIHLITLSPF